MDFAITPDQTLMQDSLVRSLAPLDRVRAYAGNVQDPGTDLWQAMTEFGLPGLLIPETYGGLGLGLLDAALMAQALGQGISPVPFLGTCILAPLALLGSGSPEQQSHWLPALARGDVRVAAALSEPIAGVREGAGVSLNHGKLSGKALFVEGGLTADLILVVDQGGGLHLVAGDSAGLTRAAMTSIDQTRRLAELSFDQVTSDPLPGPSCLTRLRDAAWVMLAADSLGACDAMLEKAVAYAKERKQFGRVIGSFQAVKHLCAEMAAEIEPMRSLIWYAAYAFDEAPAEASLMAAHAKAHSSEIGRFVARTATEVHGGMGITDLLGLHFWFKRLGLNRQWFGSPERVREAAAAIQGF